MNRLVGDRIYSLRKKLGLSQEEFANRIGVTRQVVSKWESNQVIPLTDKLKKISEEFNISYDEIFSDQVVNKDNNRQIKKYIVLFIFLIIIEIMIIVIYTYIQDNKDMKYRCIGTKTYYIDKIYDSDDDNYKYVTIIDSSSNVLTIKMKKVITNNLDINSTYEFIYRSNNKDNSIEDIIKNNQVVNIIKSNKDKDNWINIDSCNN